MDKLYIYKNDSLSANITDADSKKGIVTGYFSKFNNVDGDGDIIKKGSFAKTIKEQGPNSGQPRIKHLLNHDPSQPLGKLISLKEDADGLSYESQIGTHTLGLDFIKMVESGLITEHSIGFKIVKRNQIQSYEDYNKRPEKGLFEISEIKLYEGSSLTAWGANPLTPITSLKSELNIDLILSHQFAIEKFCKNTDATDETIQMLLLHSKQLTQLICDIKNSIVPTEITQPQDDITDIIREFNNKLKN